MPFQMLRISSIRTKIKITAAAFDGGTGSRVETPLDLIEALSRVETDGALATEKSWDTLKINEPLFDGVRRHVYGHLNGSTNTIGGSFERSFAQLSSSLETSNCLKPIDVRSDATTMQKREVEEDADELSLFPSPLPPQQEEPISTSKKSSRSSTCSTPSSSLKVASVKLYCSFDPCCGLKIKNNDNCKRRKEETNRLISSSSSYSIYQTPPLYIAEWKVTTASASGTLHGHDCLSQNKENKKEGEEEKEKQSEKGLLTVFTAAAGECNGVTTLGDVLTLAAPPKTCPPIRALENTSSTRACTSRWVATLTFVVGLYDGAVGHRHGCLMDNKINNDDDDSAYFKGSFIDPRSNYSPSATALVVPVGRIPLPLDDDEALEARAAREKRRDDESMQAIIVAHLEARELKLSQMRAESQATPSASSSQCGVVNHRLNQHTKGKAMRAHLHVRDTPLKVEASPCLSASARRRSAATTNRSSNPIAGDDYPRPLAAVSSTSAAARAMVASLPHDEVFAYVRRHGSRAFNEITHSARQAARTDTRGY